MAPTHARNSLIPILQALLNRLFKDSKPFINTTINRISRALIGFHFTSQYYLCKGAVMILTGTKNLVNRFIDIVHLQLLYNLGKVITSTTPATCRIKSTRVSSTLVSVSMTITANSFLTLRKTCILETLI